MRLDRAVAVTALALLTIVGGVVNGSGAPLQLSGSPARLAAAIHQAQVGPGGLIDPGRDCQTLRQCRFARGGLYRGCISTYSCRVCRLVASSCTVTGRDRVCQSMRCSWGA